MENERQQRETERIAAENKRKEEYAKGRINGHKFVDMGLPSGLKWATCNVGASKPDDYGDFYAWGELETKKTFIVDNCETYCEIINDISGNPMYDVAKAKWGGSWRIPTKEEFMELLNTCDWDMITLNGENKGYKVTSRNNGNSIIFPAAGEYMELLYFAGSMGEYRCSTPYGGEDSTHLAYGLTFSFGWANVLEVSWAAREKGHPVRPVSD